MRADRRGRYGYCRIGSKPYFGLPNRERRRDLGVRGLSGTKVWTVGGEPPLWSVHNTRGRYENPRELYPASLPANKSLRSL